MRVSIVIDNFDYERFLGAAIDSALAQTHDDVEVVVVDDGSTDGSRDIMAGYGDGIVGVMKTNGGQGSAVNAGFAACSGDAVILLNADDMLLPSAAAEVARLLADPRAVKVHWPLLEVDVAGRPTGARRPLEPLAEGDLAALLLTTPDHVWPPHSGNAYPRRFLEAVLPVPESEYPSGVDTYLAILALAFGELRAAEPQTLWRRHGSNDSSRAFAVQLERVLGWTEAAFARLESHCEARGVAADPEAWRRRTWAHRLTAAAAEVDALVPPRVPFILVDDTDWGMGPDERRRPIPFLERDGVWWGPAADAATAIAELERLREDGAAFAVFAWQSFWWLEHFPELREHLDARYTRVADNERLIAFAL